MKNEFFKYIVANKDLLKKFNSFFICLFLSIKVSIFFKFILFSSTPTHDLFCKNFVKFIAISTSPTPIGKAKSKISFFPAEITNIRA